ncbi:hypothetical protein PR003_g1002 [Phytophthora rubi]|uniref:Uncharacterized protein n=1 Tax=Phytophthora rubi TaxID=129364 RepID=A0A6A4G4G8_9STRA|nr:hypothetical protein PR003_g1002 [Phytophthora rubi]
MTRVSEEVAALRNNIVTAGSIGNEGGLEDPLCANDDAPSECAPKSTLEIGVGKDKDTVHLPETIISSPARAVEYADKAVQVDLGDLNVQVEVVDEPPRGLSVNYTFGDTSRNGEGETFADGERSTVHVDVGCEAMQTASNSITDEGECQIEEERSSQKGGVEVEEDSDDEECQFKEEASSQNGGVEVDEESGDEDSGDEEMRDVWKNDVVDATVDSPDSLYDKRADGVSSANASSGYPEQQTPDCIENSKHDHESTLPTMQNEKLELVYEMLREMRGSYFGKLLTKPSVAPGAVICGASDMQPVYDKSSFVSHEGNVGDKRCSCPSPTASTVPISPKARELIFDESIARDMPSSIGLEQQAFVHSSKRISPPQLPAIGLHNSSIPSALRSSLRSTDGVNQFQVSAGIRRLSSSDIPESKARYSRQAVEKDGHSSVHSLFAHDSETERIARIMQGSMNYWMKDDSSSSCDDGEIDEEETDDDCYF